MTTSAVVSVARGVDFEVAWRTPGTVPPRRPASLVRRFCLWRMAHIPVSITR